ncbi:MAG TPA: sugar isomerase domain-containing protein [Terriglobia bacterium]|nr:sugar isomerase domain-containing protein [Terriglobia bacterium]
MSELRFIAVAHQIIEKIESTQKANLIKAAELYARCVARDGLIHLWGGGHSAMGVQETFPRIGSIVGFHPIVELPLTYYSNVVGTCGLRQSFFLERLSGYAEAILSNYEFGPEDCLEVISSTGINNVAIEMALGARQRGMPVVAITSAAHQSATVSRHPSGKRLVDVADIVIDNCTPPGDASILVAGCDYPTSATSSVAVMTIVQTLNALVAEKLVELGHKPLILGSPHFVAKVEKSEENLGEYYAEFRRRTRRL